MTPDPKPSLPSAPRLPERAAIYIAKDGTVQFGALFEGLIPVARALAAQVELPRQTEREASVGALVTADAGLASAK